MQPVTNLVGVMVIRPLLLMTTALILTAAPHALQAQDLSPDERARQVEARMTDDEPWELHGGGREIRRRAGTGVAAALSARLFGR